MDEASLVVEGTNLRVVVPTSFKKAVAKDMPHFNHHMTISADGTALLTPTVFLPLTMLPALSETVVQGFNFAGFVCIGRVIYSQEELPQVATSCGTRFLCTKTQMRHHRDTDRNLAVDKEILQMTVNQSQISSSQLISRYLVVSCCGRSSSVTSRTEMEGESISRSEISVGVGWIWGRRGDFPQKALA